MRLLIVGTLKGQLTAATKMAMDRGASVTHAERIETAMAVLRSGKGADLLMVDVAIDIRDLVLRLEAERIHVPIVACGTKNDAPAAVAAIHAGAKEYIPLPPDPEMIAAVLAAVADDRHDLIYRDEAMAHVVRLAQQIAASDASILTGESGTGKEVMARYVHNRSSRSRGPFHLRQLRRHSGAAPGIRAVRARKRGIHRRGGPPDREVRGSKWRHAAARRDFGNGRTAAGQAVARPAGARR
jgi:two-component system response regulator FlrC